MVEVTCPHCGAKYKVAGLYQGGNIEKVDAARPCAACGKVFDPLGGRRVVYSNGEK